jgi:hypothetical protein
MAIKKNEILNALKNDLKAADTLRRTWFNKIEDWKNETAGELYGNEVQGKSKIVSKDIYKQREWMIPSLADPFLSTPDVVKCNPVTFEDAESARQTELLLNTQFCRKFPRYNFIMKSLRVLATEGTLVVQTGWDYEDEEVDTYVEKVMTDEYGVQYVEMVEETVTQVKKNQPTAVVCRNEDIYIDPTCMDDMDKCQFVIHRYESDLSTLRADGRYKNLEKVAQREAGNVRGEADYYPEDLTYFDFEDAARKKIVVHEYWGNYDVNGDGIAEPIVCAWVGDIIIRLQSNPYPDQKPPFVVVPFNAVPFQMHGESLASSIGDNQKVKTAIIRGVIDNMAQSNNGQVGMRHGALDMNNRKKFLSGKNFEYNGNPGDFWQGGYNNIPSSAFDMLGVQSNEIESQTGVKSFSGGISGSSLGGTATGARGALDATATRRMSLVRNVAENLIKPLMRKWMAYNAEFLEEEEVVRITNAEFVPVRKDDLGGRIDIEIAVATAEDNAGKAEQLSFLLQTMGPNQDFQVTQLMMAELARLSRMPELEKQIKEYNPQPSPEQQMLQQLELEKKQLENKKLQADIEDKLARAGENIEDRKYKAWKAEVEKAKARKLEAESDLKDLDFLKADNEYDRVVENERALRDQAHQKEMAVFQKLSGDKNIGMVR